MTLLMLAAVTAILPAVAVADVMITGNIDVNGTSNSPFWDLEIGPNYAQAAAVGAIDFNTGNHYLASDTSHSGQQYIASLDLQGMEDYSTYMLNVLEFNITLPFHGAPQGVIALAFNGGDFPSGAKMMVTAESVGEMSISAMQAAFAHNTPYDNHDQTVAVVSLNNGEVDIELPSGDVTATTSTLTGGHNTYTMTYFISFFLPPYSNYSHADTTLSLTYLSPSFVNSGPGPCVLLPEIPASAPAPAS